MRTFSPCARPRYGAGGSRHSRARVRAALHQFHRPCNASASVLKSAVKRITCPPKCSTSYRRVPAAPRSAADATGAQNVAVETGRCGPRRNLSSPIPARSTGLRHSSSSAIPALTVGKSFSGRSCRRWARRGACVSLHDPETGEELCRRLVATPGEPSDETWGDVSYEDRVHRRVVDGPQRRSTPSSMSSPRRPSPGSRLSTTFASARRPATAAHARARRSPALRSAAIKSCTVRASCAGAVLRSPARCAPPRRPSVIVRVCSRCAGAVPTR